MTPEAELLKGAVTEVARLLQADGAMIYLVDEASETLRFAYDAGITDRRARRLIRDLTLPIGVGMLQLTLKKAAECCFTGRFDKSLRIATFSPYDPPDENLSF